ncbi:putative protein OS=Streptomyces violarus OX=67380 GN=FHS41_007729 PE=4 SV=1 [Streptomyces violarus]
MIERLCDQEASLTGVYGALDVETGEFKTQDEYLRDVFGLWKPAGPWELLRGWCGYAEASTWSIKGDTVRTSRWIGNQGSADDKETFVSSYSTKTFAKKSVGGTISLSLAKSIFSGTVGGSAGYEWGWGGIASSRPGARRPSRPADRSPSPGRRTSAWCA